LLMPRKGENQSAGSAGMPEKNPREKALYPRQRDLPRPLGHFFRPSPKIHPQWVKRRPVQGGGPAGSKNGQRAFPKASPQSSGCGQIDISGNLAQQNVPLSGANQIAAHQNEGSTNARSCAYLVQLGRIANPNGMKVNS